MRIFIVLLLIGLVAAVGFLFLKPSRFVLEFPADCRIGEECWIFSHVDLKEGAGYTDNQCGARTYEGHKGTDIALTRFISDKTGVLAAASGTVIGTRNDVPDNPVGSGDTGPPGKECGNGMRIEHQDGWITQYCHLKAGSVNVQQGQSVQAGDLLGLIGNSGRSEVPHLHFQVEKAGKIVDPFTQLSPSPDGACGGGDSLWSTEAESRFGPYSPAHIRAIGFASEKPSLRQVQKTGGANVLTRSGQGLVLYTTVYGVPAGTQIQFTIRTPDGATLLESSYDVPETKARVFRFAGKKTPPDGWPVGRYVGEITVNTPTENGVVVSSRTSKILLK